jgi:DNA-binding beta-propeller fold protein YncE
MVFKICLENKIKRGLFFWILLVFFIPEKPFSQNATIRKLPFEDSTLQNSRRFTILPYNRLIQSAGRVITYGDSSLENHALDVCLLPNKKFIVVEDRYGIAILKIQTNKILAKWRFNNGPEWQGMMSTYSGITSFDYRGRTFIAWGAAGGRNNGESALMIAEWDGKSIQNVSAIKIEKMTPAGVALPNQVIANTEDGILYLYLVLNGNNQLIKIRFEDRKFMWTARTDVAPYGVCITNGKVYVTNWAGPVVTDSALENAGTPWGSAYTNPQTGATRLGSLSIIDIATGNILNELTLGLHPDAIIKSIDNRFLYISNGNSDNISVVDIKKEMLIDSIETGLFSKYNPAIGSSPNALCIDSSGRILYVANGMDNAIAVVKLKNYSSPESKNENRIAGYIPTEAYPSGVVLINHTLYVANLEARGSRVLSESNIGKQAGAKTRNAYTIHKEMASLSIIAVPNQNELNRYTEKVKTLNLFYRISLTNAAPRKNLSPLPVPERIGEPSVFKHVVYIIKENKTYDQVFGDISRGRGDRNLCIYGDSITPNQHKLASDFSLLDNYYASGKCSAEGHQWTDAAMVSDYIEKNVRAWFRSYPHRQTDALVYNKSGFIWNNALDHGKTVRIYGEACTTHFEENLKWIDFYERYLNREPLNLNNTSTIARIRPIISPDFPDCDNINFSDQIRAEIFIKELKEYEQKPGDNLPALMVLSLPDDHTGGTSPNLPTPRAMVADNDLAVGKIIDAISHSRFWNSSVIFITEDDSQSGWDHISSYRTTCLVISPYSKLNKTIHTNYNQTSVIRTIEQILGIPPMNILDATALPMFDCFTNAKRDFRYQSVPNIIPLNEMNKPMTQLKGKAKYYAWLSANKVFKEVDGGDDNTMNKILWFDAKGNEKYPSSK